MRESLPIFGTFYTKPFLGKDQPTRVKSDLSNPHSYYHDDAIRLTPDDAKNFVGKPILIEHGKDREHGDTPVGEIVKAWMDGQNKLVMHGRVFVDTPYNRKIYQDIKNGHLRGLSVGYNNKWKDMRTNEIDYKVFNEISLVKKPFFEGSEVSVAASQKSLSDSTEKKNYFFLEITAMADTQQDNTATTPKPDAPQPIPENNEAVELLKNSEELSKTVEQKNKEMEEMRAKLAAFEAQQEELKAFRAEKAKREAEAREKKLKEADEYIKSMTEFYKKQNGADAELPKEFVETMRNSWAVAAQNAEAAKTVDVMASMMGYFKEQAERNERERVEKEELKKQIKLTSDKLGSVNASYQAVTKPVDNSEKAEATRETSSGFNSLFHFPRPSAAEIKLYGLDENEYGSVTASGTKPIPELPKHNQTGVLKNSMRNRAPGLFYHLWATSGWEQVPLDGYKEGIIDSREVSL
jgi:hypothetical protein